MVLVSADAVFSCFCLQAKNMPDAIIKTAIENPGFSIIIV
jgi:hypothetical protein